MLSTLAHQTSDWKRLTWWRSRGGWWDSYPPHEEVNCLIALCIFWYSIMCGCNENNYIPCTYTQFCHIAWILSSCSLLLRLFLAKPWDSWGRSLRWPRSQQKLLVTKIKVQQRSWQVRTQHRFEDDLLDANPRILQNMARKVLASHWVHQRNLAEILNIWIWQVQMKTGACFNALWGVFKQSPKRYE